MQNTDNQNGSLKLEHHDKVVSFEFDDTFIKFRFSEGKTLRLTIDDIGEDMLKKLKKQILQSESVVDFFLSETSLKDIINRSLVSE